MTHATPRSLIFLFFFNKCAKHFTPAHPASASRPPPTALHANSTCSPPPKYVCRLSVTGFIAALVIVAVSVVSQVYSERKKKRKREGDEEKGEERCGTPPTHQCPSATTAHPIFPPEPNLACMDVPTCDNRDMGLYPKHSKPSPWRGDAVSKLEKSLLDLSHARISSGSFHAPSKTHTAVLSARCARFGDPLKRCVHGSRWFRVAIAQFVSICIRREINKSISFRPFIYFFY